MTSRINLLIVEKNGDIKETKIKKEEFSELELYKKAGFKSKQCFEERHSWKNVVCKTKTYDQITIYAKTKGNAGRENKYELPPPLDVVLYYGSMIIVHYDSDRFPQNLSKSEWESIYEKLFGGFESLDDEDEEEEEEQIDPSKLDKYGYEKDGFVVEDEEEELEYDSELSEEEYFDV